MIVLDASIVVPWFVSDEASSRSRQAFSAAAAEGAVVPALWQLELRNVLVVRVRRRRLTVDRLSEALALIPALSIETEDRPPFDAVVDLALAHHLTVYDATYLELAARRRLPLATLDSKLARAAMAEGVTTLA